MGDWSDFDSDDSDDMSSFYQKKDNIKGIEAKDLWKEMIEREHRIAIINRKKIVHDQIIHYVSIKKKKKDNIRKDKEKKDKERKDKEKKDNERKDKERKDSPHEKIISRFHDKNDKLLLVKYLEMFGYCIKKYMIDQCKKISPDSINLIFEMLGIDHVIIPCKCFTIILTGMYDDLSQSSKTIMQKKHKNGGYWYLFHKNLLDPT